MIYLLDPGHYEAQSMPAAVKRIETVNFKLYENEIKQLRELNHPNVVRYFATKSVDAVYYIAMEKGDCSLGKYMKNNSEDTEILIKLLHDSCLGLTWLHERSTVHRDVNPNNILVVKINNLDVGKLCDFGFSKNLPLLQSHWCSSPCGTEDYMPPEVAKALDDDDEIVYRRETDIYALGVTMFNILSRGKHPGGVRTERLHNVSKGKLSFEQWKVTSPPVVQFQSCIERMICFKMQNRASINFVLNHPWSWSPRKDLDFILATHKYLDSGTSDAKSDREKLKMKLSSDLKVNEANRERGWWANLCPKVLEYLKNPSSSKKNYDSMDYFKLIAFIRDKDQHFSELPADLKNVDVFGNAPITYMKYFTKTFHGLIPTVYMFLQDRKQLQCFKGFYDG
jgi:serine/threonine-protein kinase/endoribonuclease IRE1